MWITRRIIQMAKRKPFLWPGVSQNCKQQVATISNQQIKFHDIIGKNDKHRKLS